MASDTHPVWFDEVNAKWKMSLVTTIHVTCECSSSKTQTIQTYSLAHLKNNIKKKHIATGFRRKATTKAHKNQQQPTFQAEQH